VAYEEHGLVGYMLAAGRDNQEELVARRDGEPLAVKYS
jgi:hypothetical protein